MRVAIITDRIYPFYLGGYEYLFYNLSVRLPAPFEVSVYTSMDVAEKTVGNARYFRISKKYKYTNSKGNHRILDSLKFLMNLRRSVEELGEYDIVIMNTIPYLGYGWVLSKMKSKRIAIFLETWYEYLKEMNIFLRVGLLHEIRRIVENSDSIVAISSTTERSLKENYDARDVSRIPIGIDTDTIDTIKEGEKYDISYVGRLVKIKHVDDIIRACKIVVRNFPHIKIAIGGEGEYKKRIERIVETLNLEENVSFMGRMSEEEKYRMLKSSRIFVLPSEREGFSVSTLEAMYCGAVPVIAEPKYQEVFGSSDFVTDRKTGLYYHLGDTDDLAKKIIVLLRDDELFSKMRYDGMKIAGTYGWTSVLKEYMDTINSLVG